HPGLANHIATSTLAAGFDPAFSHLLELDHGIMTVYYELDHDMKLPLVPIVQNCAVPPLMPVRRAYEFGKALGDAIRPYDGLARGAVIGGGGLSHWIGTPRVGDIDEEFDRWLLGRRGRPGHGAGSGGQRFRNIAEQLRVPVGFAAPDVPEARPMAHTEEKEST